MAPKRVSPNYNAMPTSAKRINLVKNLDLILAHPSGSQSGPGHPARDEPLLWPLFTLLLNVQAFSPGLERGFNTGVREDTFCPTKPCPHTGSRPADSCSDGLHLSFGIFGFEQYFNTGIVKILPKSISVFTFLFLEPSRDRDLFLK